MTSAQLLQRLSSFRWHLICRVIWNLFHLLNRRPLRLVDLDLSWWNLVGFRLSAMIFHGCTMDAVNLDHANLTGAVFQGCNLSRAALQGTNLTGVVFQGCNLRGASLCWSVLRGAKFRDSDLYQACLLESDLTKADLRGADLRFVELRGACIRACDLRGAALPRPGTASKYGAFLDLLQCDGLEEAIFDTPTLASRYLQEAAVYAKTAHGVELAWEPHFRAVEAILRKRGLWPDEDRPYAVPTDYGLVWLTAELMTQIKANPAMVNDLPSRHFEELVAELFAALGWWVQLSPPSNDGGFDVFALAPDDSLMGSKRVVIECKRYAKERKVGVATVRALCGTKERYEADRAVLVTTAGFTRGARGFCKRREEEDVSLIDGAGVEEMLSTYKPRPKCRLYCHDSPHLRSS